MDLFSQTTDTSYYYRGDKLTVARRAAMLSMEELANRIGKTRQFVCKLEKNAEPTEDILEKICGALGITKTFLYTERDSYIDTEKFHFRSLKTRTKTVTMNIKCRVEMLGSVIKKLEEEVELPEVDLPDVSCFDIKKFSEIERLSESVREYWELGNGPISNVVELLEYIGIIVANSRGTDGKVDAFSIPAARPLIMLDNRYASTCRNRFTLSHELGHLLFHDDIVTGDSTTESQADYFASCFLIPRISFVKEFPCAGTGRFDWDKMVAFKQRWKVSLRSIIYRATQLGLIDQSKAKTGYIHLNTRGFVQVELGDNLIPKEELNVLPQMINLLDENSWLQLLREVGMTESQFKSLFGVEHEYLRRLDIKRRRASMRLVG